jgi:hypothetical protein
MARLMVDVRWTLVTSMGWQLAGRQHIYVAQNIFLVAGCKNMCCDAIHRLVGMEGRNEVVSR